jgi:[ribosomal protein S18]-alanine N-acetyltransferase
MCAESRSLAKGLTVTPCCKENLSEVQGILQSASGAAAWSELGLADALEHYSSCFLVARQGKEIAGFIAGRKIADQGEILNLAVLPKCRRQGVGRILVEELFEVFEREHVVEVFLEVRESNATAIAFYESLGFREVGKRPRYYQNPVEAALLLKVPTHFLSRER